MFNVVELKFNDAKLSFHAPKKIYLLGDSMAYTVV